MASLNKVILIGNLGRDPETRYLPNGDAVTSISVATTETWKDKNGDKQEKTEWHRVSLFRRLGEIAGEYLKKGSQVYIEGRIEYGSYEKDGVKHYTTDIIGDDMQMLGSGAGRSDSSSERSSRPQQSAAPQRREAPASRQAPQVREDMDPFRDDDIPF